MADNTLCVKQRVENELSIMPENYKPIWPHKGHEIYKFSTLEWLARWGTGFFKSDRCAPRGLASKRSNQDYFKNGKN